MNEMQKLGYALNQFAGLTEADFAMSMPFWHFKEFKKGDAYNDFKSVCKYLGFVTEGAFRSYIIAEKSGQEKNVFLSLKHGFVVAFKSFINQAPCDYRTQAIADSQVLCISHSDLLALYAQSHNWERFGRLLAQEGFNMTIDRLERFIMRLPEERYLDLINKYPDVFNEIPLYHISSYLGIQGPSLSRIRKRISGK